MIKIRGLDNQRGMIQEIIQEMFDFTGSNII